MTHEHETVATRLASVALSRFRAIVFVIAVVTLCTESLHADDRKSALPLAEHHQGIETRYHQYYDNGNLKISSTAWSVGSSHSLVSRSDVLDVSSGIRTVFFYPELRNESNENQRIRESLILETFDPTEVMVRAIHNLLPQTKALNSKNMLKKKLIENNRGGTPESEFSLDLTSSIQMEVSLKTNLSQAQIASITIKQKSQAEAETLLTAVASDFVEVIDSQWYPKTIRIAGPNGIVVFLRQTSTISVINGDSDKAQADLLATRIYIDQLEKPVEKNVVAKPRPLAAYEYWFLLNVVCLAGLVIATCFYNRI